MHVYRMSKHQALGENYGITCVTPAEESFHFFLSKMTGMYKKPLFVHFLSDPVP